MPRSCSTRGPIRAAGTRTTRLRWFALLEAVLSRHPELASDDEVLTRAFDAAARQRRREAWRWLSRFPLPDGDRAVAAAIGAHQHTDRESARRLLEGLMTTHPARANGLLLQAPGDEELVALALARGADPNTRGPHGETPVLIAGLHQDARAARRLIAAGADALLADAHGNTLSAYATLIPGAPGQGRNPEMQALVEELGLGASDWDGPRWGGLPPALARTPAAPSPELGTARMVVWGTVWCLGIIAAFVGAIALLEWLGWI